MKLRALDLCCAAGGVSVGLAQAGFDVTGCDIKRSKRYPYYMVEIDFRNLSIPWIKRNFDFIWASPPCQFATEMNNDKSKHINLIPDARKLAKASGLPYVIENVMGAAEHLRDPVKLCGTMFGLGCDVGGTWFQLSRERLFESNFEIIPPRDRFDPKLPVVGVYGGHARNRSKEWGGRGTRDFEGYSQKEIASIAMGIGWMTLGEMSEAIPPVFAAHIGRAAIRHIERKRRAA